MFVNNSGEWKLGGVEYVSSALDVNITIQKATPALDVYDPPEKNDPSKQRLSTKWLVSFFPVTVCVLIP